MTIHFVHEFKERFILARVSVLSYGTKGTQNPICFILVHAGVPRIMDGTLPQTSVQVVLEVSPRHKTHSLGRIPDSSVMGRQWAVPSTKERRYKRRSH
ncbi:hypothetical protein CDAR_519531 [Caerostris darwini]|uniref:Uncharacterized protein n=1 Tax=Caerostris darwini TaxID=1538125 RepID=A0AAV4TQ52_9ARAC|nr:hypothetical protein CDAR_519531 [Caerostris darwini]